jgi:hypothetical protein
MPRCRREVGLRAQASTAGGWAVAVKHLRVMPRGRVMRSFDETVRDECDLCDGDQSQYGNALSTPVSGVAARTVRSGGTVVQTHFGVLLRNSSDGENVSVPTS